MTSFVIENPILNSPFAAPTRHFAFTEDGTGATIETQRRRSSYFIPIASPRRRPKQQTFDQTFFGENRQENDDINHIRSRVALWRGLGYPDVTPVTRTLLDYWQRKDRERRLFFCQIEALETFIFLAEAARGGDVGLVNRLRDHAEAAGTPLFRQACKMATGSGKTVVMAMLIAWQALNKYANARDKRFADAFLIVTPGITIRDRPRVLLPSDPDNYYHRLDLVPADHLADLGQAKIVITNYHAFKRRDTGDAGGLTKRLLAHGQVESPFLESPGQMVNRVCRELGTKKEIVVLNDEAHHCYRSKPAEEKLTGEERKEAAEREEAARLWITGLEAIRDKVGVKVVYDLSATPFYLRGSGYREGTLFPWVVSDFSLIDAIESGIVKVPRVPVADNALAGDQPTYRDLWQRIREQLPRKGRGNDDAGGTQNFPRELEGALRSLYGHYEQAYAAWRDDPDAEALGRTPPVFIVVCSNTSVSKLVFDWISGRATGKELPDGSPYVAPGNLALFSNVGHNRWLARPNTILIDSEQLESGDGMSDDFKKIAGHQIQEFKAAYRQRYPERDAAALTDEDLLREVMNTVGKPGKLGEEVRCVVSVSMLTEGWDVNTVTHILGVRAFGTQLLCEQVVGRGLRRRSYVVNSDGMFDPEYAEVYGVPFAFMPCAGTLPQSRERRDENRPGRIRAVPERAARDPVMVISFPRVTGYRYELPPAKLEATFTPQSRLTLSTADLPTRTENAPIVGETAVHTLDDLRQRREQEVVFTIARLVLQHYFPAEGPGDEPAGSQVWLFPQIVAIVRRWLAECVVCKDDVFPQLLLLEQWAYSAAEKVHRAIAAAGPGEPRVRAVLRPYDAVGSTVGVSFDSTKELWRTDERKCHVNFAPLDSKWEGHFARTLEELAAVRAYVKNQGLHFKIPYAHEGRPGFYYPDYLVRLDDGRGDADLLTLVVEVSGQEKDDKDAKVDTARTMWVPAVNAERAFGRWDFLEIIDPLTAKGELRAYLAGRAPGGGTK